MHKLHFDRALIPEGWREGVTVTVLDGTIAAVSTEPDPAAERVGGIAVPGTGNLHSHAFQRGFAGLTERRGAGEDHFWTWREAMYGLALRLTPDDVEAIAAQAFVEMLEGGFTAVAEFHYLHHAPDGRPYAEPAELAFRVAAAAERAGIGLTLLPVFYAHGGFGAAPPGPGQRRFISSLDTYPRLVEGTRRAVAGLPGGRVGVAPHSLRAATLEEIGAVAAAFPRGPVHIHIAEQEREVEDGLAAHGLRPVELLLDRLPVDPRWCLVHATHVTADEMRGLARSGAVAGLCPVTESDLGDGIFPAVGALAAGVPFGVGSDSNVMISLAAELRTLEYSQRLRDRARNRLAPSGGGSTGRRLLDAARAGADQALGRPAGAIAAGHPADLVVLDGADPTLAGRRGDDALDAWIFAAPRSPVARVYVAGRLVVDGGRHVARTGIAEAFRACLERLAR